MTQLLAIAGGSVDPRPLCCCCCAEPMLLVAAISACYGLVRDSARLTALAVLVVGWVGAVVLVQWNLPAPSPVVIGEEEVIDSDVIAEHQVYRAALRQTLGLWVVSAAAVGIAVAGLVVQRLARPPRTPARAVPPAPAPGDPEPFAWESLDDQGPDVQTPPPDDGPGERGA